MSGYQETDIKPGTLPNWSRLYFCEITIRDNVTGHLAQITFDDLYQAIKDRVNYENVLYRGTEYSA